MPSFGVDMTKRLDAKLARIRAGEYQAKDFIIADAKDADMSVGLTAPAPYPGNEIGQSGPGIYRTRQEYIGDMKALIDQDVIDIMLTSAANGEVLSQEPGQLKEITLAVRGNDSTDIWNPRASNYTESKSRPYQSVNLTRVREFCDLALYSFTFNNDTESDLQSLAAFKEFRMQATDLGMRYFLEVFNPNAPRNLKESDYGSFVNDSIYRTLAGVTQAERPIFLKVAFNGQKNLKELTEHDSTLIVGLLGGSSGTTRDTFELLAQGEQCGARVALFGRKIQRAESQCDLVRLMRLVIEGAKTPTQAVEEYHECLSEKKIRAQRSLEVDLQVTDPALQGE
jgi:DhnA family fructose-bisphosphate aldolase class Ia